MCTLNQRYTKSYTETVQRQQGERSDDATSKPKFQTNPKFVARLEKSGLYKLDRAWAVLSGNIKKQCTIKMCVNSDLRELNIYANTYF